MIYALLDSALPNFRKFMVELGDLKGFKSAVVLKRLPEACEKLKGFGGVVLDAADCKELKACKKYEGYLW